MPKAALASLLLVVFLSAAPSAASEAGGAYGKVSLANSGVAAAQSDFTSGLALLHDFEYLAAADAFRRAQATDPAFALAYWGEAMTYTHPVWKQQDLEAARSVLKRLAPTAAERRTKALTESEKAWLDAVETLYGEGTKEERDRLYADAMARLYARFPAEPEAAAFYGLALLGTAHAGRDASTYMRAAGILEGAWIEHRDHPGLLHYLIHCYDDPTHAPLGLRAARLYASVAPDAGHAVHMTSHIFLALGLWRETVDTNIAAIAAVNRMRAAQGKDPAHCGHYFAWLEYAHLQLGEVDAAREVLAGCRAAAALEIAQADTGHAMDSDETLGGAFASMRLVYLLESSDWQGEPASWPLPPVAGPNARLDFAFARALGAIALGSAEETRLALADLETVGREVIAIESAKNELNPSNRVRPEIFLLEARAALAEKSGDLASAERQLREATVLEDALPIAFGPPAIEKPTHELLGEFLLRRNRTAEARAELERAQALAPGRRAALRGLVAAAP
ncbi:MAG: hypothetical protein ABIV06_11205 [Thermoanaerobaculia bacterium]